MAEPTQTFTFEYRDIVEALVKRQGIHEGIWGLYVEFGIQGANIGPPGGPLRPAAIVPVLKLGIQRMPQENNLAVDAAKVNPQPAQPATGPRRRSLLRGT